MTISETINSLEDKYYSIENQILTIKGIELENQDLISESEINKSVMINSSRFSYNSLIIKNCKFKSIKFRNIQFQILKIEDSDVDELIAHSLHASELSFVGNARNIDIQYANIHNIKIHTYNNVKTISFKNTNKIQKFELYVNSAESIDISDLNQIGSITIADNESTVGIVKSLSIKNLKECEILSIFSNDNKVIETIEFANNKITEIFEIRKIAIQEMKIIPRFKYDRLKANFFDIKIDKYISFENIDLNESVFNGLDLSKTKFESSLISKCKFNESKISYKSDISHLFTKIGMIGFALLLLLCLEHNIDLSSNANIIYNIGVFEINITIVISVLMLILIYILFIVTSFKHTMIYDEKELKEKSMIFEVNVERKNELERIESIYRQLKVIFESDQNKQMAHELLYSENLMKIKQKHLFKENCFNIDFYNYIVNGFGRRWGRALSHLVFIYLLLTIPWTTNIDYIVKDKAPAYIQETNKTLTQENNVTQIVKKLNALKQNSVYTLSKIDVFKVKTNGWFEEKSYWAYLLSNISGIMLIFLLGSFIVAFKRRLDR